jgi:hypothetical protein
MGRLGRSTRILPLVLATIGCQDITRFSTQEDRYEGTVVGASFVRAGIAEGTRLCLTFDGARAQSRPGFMTSSDGRFRSEPLRPIPELLHDSLASLKFGDDRHRQLLFMVRPEARPDTATGDVTAILSLMDTDSVELRLLQGAPPLADAPPPETPAAGHLFGIFRLTRQAGPCSF